MFGPHHRHGGFGFFGSHRRWADSEPPGDWPFGRFGRRWGGFGGFGGFNPGGPGERFFGRGDLKYIILDLLKDQPRHGYDIIRALEDRMRGGAGSMSAMVREALDDYIAKVRAE